MIMKSETMLATVPCIRINQG